MFAVCLFVLPTINRSLLIDPIHWKEPSETRSTLVTIIIIIIIIIISSNSSLHLLFEKNGSQQPLRVWPLNYE